MVNKCTSVSEYSIGLLGDVQVMDHFTEGPAVTMLALTVKWGAKAKSRVGLGDGRHHLIRLPLEDEDAREIFCGGCGGIGLGTLGVMVQLQPRESWLG